jgi:hypothetical protein
LHFRSWFSFLPGDFRGFIVLAGRLWHAPVVDVALHGNPSVLTSSPAALLTQELTDPELKRTNPACDRTVSVYGYVRGTHFKAHQKVHIPGFGDVFPREVSLLPDPCPLPDKLKKACAADIVFGLCICAQGASRLRGSSAVGVIRLACVHSLSQELSRTHSA